MNPTAYLEVRSQHVVGTWPKCGPDRYVAVQIVPAGVEPLKCLNMAAAKRRGIQIVYCGEGYSNRCQTNRSMYSQAVLRARAIVESVNNA